MSGGGFIPERRLEPRYDGEARGGNFADERKLREALARGENPIADLRAYLDQQAAAAAAKPMKRPAKARGRAAARKRAK